MSEQKIKITLPDGSIKEYLKGTSGMDIAMSISEGLARNVLAAKVNGVVVDATLPIEGDSEVQLLTWNDREGKDVFWHSSAHLMAEALEELYPGIKFGIGPTVETGFYYDVDFGDHNFSADDIPKVEVRMKQLVKMKNHFDRTVVPKEEALNHFREKGDEYKVELLNDLEDGTITFYKVGDFTDLCRGPHIPNTGLIKALKLTSVAGAYWRGDETRKQLTRLYGVSFPKNKELNEYLEMLEEAAKRDHRKLGRELDLFTFSSMVGQGLPLWLPKGAILREKLEEFSQKGTNQGRIFTCGDTSYWA